MGLPQVSAVLMPNGSLQEAWLKDLIAIIGKGNGQDADEPLKQFTTVKRFTYIVCIIVNDFRKYIDMRFHRDYTFFIFSERGKYV